METRELTIETGHAAALVDLTASCERFLVELDASDGLLTVFVPHATVPRALMQ